MPSFFNVLLALLVVAPATALAQSNYDLIVGSDTVEVRLGQPTTFETPGGETLDIMLQTQPMQKFDDGVVSFLYPVEVNVTQTMIEAGIKQVMVMTAYGDGVMLQQYRGINPSFLVPMMLNEITKAEVSYGYDMDAADTEIELASGEVLKGMHATMRYLDEVKHYRVLAYGVGDQGVLLVTMADEEFEDERDGFIETVVSSLRLNAGGLGR